MTRLQTGINECLARWKTEETMWAKRAKSAGYPVLARGKYCATGREIVVVQLPHENSRFGNTHEFHADIWDAA